MSRLQQQEESAEQGAPAWIVTFADLMSLLLTFFVLLLSFSTVEVTKFRTLAGSLRSAFGTRSPLDLEDKPTGSKLILNPAPTRDEGIKDQPQEVTMARLRAALEKSAMQQQGNVEITERGVALRLSGDATFETARTELKQDALVLLEEVAGVAVDTPGTIEIEGHTDDVPIGTARFPSNWELSAARAGSAVRYLADRGVAASRMKAIGYADTHPIASNGTPQGRALNRRVEFLFHGSGDERSSAPQRHLVLGEDGLREVEEATP